MDSRIATLLIILGIIFVVSFTLFAVILNLQTTTTTTTTSTTTTTTEPTTKPTSTTTTEPTTSSTTTSTTSTTTTTMLIECGSAEDCGQPYIDGTYFCQEDTVTLMECMPRCVSGRCKVKCNLKLIDKCNKTEVCIPGRKRCVLESEFENASAFVEINSESYSEPYYGYRFKIDYIRYINDYELDAVLVDVIEPDGREDKIALSWSLLYKSDNLVIGLYGAKKDAIILWLRKS